MIGLGDGMSRSDSVGFTRIDLVLVGFAWMGAVVVKSVALVWSSVGLMNGGGYQSATTAAVATAEMPVVPMA